jgi:hypothetical protein
VSDRNLTAVTLFAVTADFLVIPRTEVALPGDLSF